MHVNKGNMICDFHLWIDSLTYPCWEIDQHSSPGCSFDVCQTCVSSDGGYKEVMCHTQLPLPHWESPRIHPPQSSAGMHLPPAWPSWRHSMIAAKTEKTNYQHLHISHESDVSSRKNLWRVIMKLISVLSQSHEGNVCARSNSAELFVPITGSAPNLL